VAETLALPILANEVAAGAVSTASTATIRPALFVLAVGLANTLVVDAGFLLTSALTAFAVGPDKPRPNASALSLFKLAYSRAVLIGIEADPDFSEVGQGADFVRFARPARTATTVRGTTFGKVLVPVVLHHAIGHTPALFLAGAGFALVALWTFPTNPAAAIAAALFSVAVRSARQFTKGRVAFAIRCFAFGRTVGAGGFRAVVLVANANRTGLGTCPATPTATVIPTFSAVAVGSTAVATVNLVFTDANLTIGTSPAVAQGLVAHGIDHKCLDEPTLRSRPRTPLSRTDLLAVGIEVEAKRRVAVIVNTFVT